MATRRIIATKTLRYGGKVLLADDEFEPSRQDARVFVEVLRQAVYAPESTPAPKPAPEVKPVAPDGSQDSPGQPWMRESSVVTVPAVGADVSEPGYDNDDDEAHEAESMLSAPSTRARALTKAQLAKEYEAATGGKPDGRWNKNRLEQELEAVRGSYRRRDMRADG